MSTNNLFKTREKTWVELYNFDNMVLTNNIILEVILKGHLFIESKIEFILRLELRDPDILNLDRMHYPQKLKLLVATGIISRENYKVYKSINEIGRKFAHNIEAEITEEDVLNIYHQFSPEFQNVFQTFKGNFEEIKGIDKKIKSIIHILWVVLYIISTPSEGKQDSAFWKSVDIQKEISFLNYL